MYRDVSLSPSYLLLPVVAVLALVVPIGRACPRTCNCYQANEVHCTFRSLLAVPAGLPAHTLRINLGFNSISRIPDSSLAGLKRAELMMLHGNDLHHIPDEVFRDMKSLQVLKLSYNKLREISSSMTFSGLTSLLRLHLDHNLLQHIHPKALLQLPSLRLLRMQGNRLHQLHPHSLCTLSLLNTYYYSTLRHVDLSNNSLTALPKEVLVTAPLLETLVLHENPWSCDCRLSWFLSWSVAHPGLMKCPSSPNCPMCASPSALEGQGLLQHSDLSCASPIISAPGRDPPSNADPVELQPIETFREPIGSAFLDLSDQQGNHVDLSCNVTHSADSPDISPLPDLSLSSSDPLSLAVSLSLVCPVERESYEELWRILAYYSEAAVRLEREIMLSKAPALAYRYRQTVETEGYYHTGVSGSVKANPHWLLQPAVSIQLNRAQSSGHRVHLTLMTRVSTRPDPISSSPFPLSPSSRASSPSLSPWVLISTNYTTTSMAAVTGGTVHLACPVLSSGNPTLQWILPDGSKCISPSSSPDGRIQTSASGLSLQRVELSDAGLYHCVARAGSDEDILPLQLVVVESSGPPAGAQVGPSVTGFIGETLSLPCNSSGMPTPDISWVLPDGKIVQNGVAASRGLRIESNGSLSLIRPSPRDFGQYRCLAVNQYGADSLSMQLDLSPRSAPPFRNSFPRRPQSAAGRSTRIRASLLREKIIEEGSGDQEAEENKIPTVSRTYSRPRQPPINQRFPMGHPRRRGPIRGGSQRRGGSSLSNSEQRKIRFNNRQRGASTKQKIDPRKWADLLAKIRQKTAPNNISQPTGEPTTKPFGREINNEVGRAKEIVEEEMEGSSIDDQSLHEEGLHRVHPVQPDLDEWTKIYTGIQRENALNPDTERGTEKETYTQTYIQTDRSTEPQTDRDNQSETYMQTITVTNTPKPISGSNEIVPEPIDERNPKPNATESTSSNPIQGVFLNLVPNSRPQRPWNARRRLGQRRRIMNRPRGRPVTPPQPLPDPTNARSSTVTTGVTTIQTHTTITSLAPVLEDSNNLRHSNSGELNPQSTNKKSEGSSAPSDSTVSVISSLLPNSLSTPSSSSPTTTQTDLLTHSVKFPESEQITHISTHPPVNTHTTAKQTSSPATMTLSPTHTLTDTRKSIDRNPDVSLSSGIATATAKSSLSATPVKFSTNTTITPTDATKQRIPIGSTILRGTPTAVNRKTTTAIYSSTLVTVTMNTAVPATASRPVSSTHEQSTNTPTMPTSTEAAVVSTITASTSPSTTVRPSISTSATPPTMSVLTTTTTSPPTTIITQRTSSSASPTTSTSPSSTPTTTTSASTRGTSRERPSPGLVDPREKPLSGLPNQNRPAPDWRNPGANTIPDSHSSRSRQPSSLPLPVSPGGSSGIPVLTNPLAPVVRSKPRIADPHVRTVSVPAQSTARLACEAQGKPHPSLTWTKVSTGVVMSVHSKVQRFEVLPNGTFVIQNVQLQDRGTYICSAHSSLGRDRMLTTLEVWSRPPRIQLANYREVSIHPGGEVRLDCMAEGVPSPLLSWVLPDRSVLTSTDSSHGRMTMHTNGTLHILASLPSDRGVYRCVASNSAGAASVSVRLHMSSLPPVIHQLREERLVLTLGMPVYTHCTARGAPPPTLRWKIPDGTVVRQSQFLHGNLFVLPNGTLHIRKAAPKDAGTYECTASNAVGADKRKVRVELREEPGGQASQAGRVGGAAAPTRQTPPPSVRHNDNTARLLDTASNLFNTTGLHSPSPFNHSRTLSHSPNTPHRSQTPKPSSPHHNNNREVSLSPSSAQPAKHNITNPSLFYPSAPVSPSKPSNKAPSTPPSPVSSLSKAHIFSTSPSTTTVHYGGDLLLHCMVSGNPVPTIIWRTPNRKLVDRHFSFERRLKVYANGSLVVQAVTEKDAGDYLCIARNKVADDYRLLRVSVVTKPAKIEHKLPPNQMVSFGGSLKVDCLASGLPDPAVRWSLPDGTTVNSVLQGVERGGRTRRLTVFDNGTLLLPAVGMGEEGEYTCFAENQGGQDIMKVKVKVVASPPAFADANYDIIRVRQGATAAISCRATGDPTPAVTWFSPSNRAIPRILGSRYFSERVVVLSDGTLEVRLAQSIDEGNYTCQESSTAGKRSRAVGLKVEVPNHRLTGGVWGPAVNIGGYGRGRKLSTGSSTGSGSSVVNTGLNEASRQYGSNNGLTSRLGSNGAGSNSYSRVSGSIPSTVINLGNSRFKPASKIVSVGDAGPTNGVTTQLGNSAGSAGVNGAGYKEMKPGNTVIPHSAVSSHVGSGVGSNGGTVSTSNAEAGVRTGSDPSSSSIANVRTNEQMLHGATSNRASSSIVGEHGLSSSLNTRTSTSTNAGTSSTAAFEKKLAVRGQTVILPCPSHGSPPPRLAWLLPGNGVLPAPYYGSRLTVHRNGSLELRGARASDAGTFVCVLRGQRGESRIQVELDILETQEVAVLSQSPHTGGSPASVGSTSPPLPLSVTLHVRGKATVDPPQRGPLVASPPRSLGLPVRSGGSVEAVRSSQRPAVFTRTASLVSIITGETLRLSCHVPQAPGYPQGSLSWTLPSGTLLSRGAEGGSGRYSVGEDGTLTVLQATVFDRGSYACRSTDDSSASVVTVPVIVIAYPPRITTGPTPVTYTRPGVAVELPCLSIATPRPTVTWGTPDMAQLRVTGQGRLYGNRYLSPQGSLIIQHPTSRDTGFYTCTAKNVVGVDTKATYLHVI